MESAFTKLPRKALPNPHCPLCGGANRCAVAECGSFDTPCWCERTSFRAELIARVPHDQQGTACICAACAALHATPLEMAMDTGLRTAAADLAQVQTSANCASFDTP